MYLFIILCLCRQFSKVQCFDGAFFFLDALMTFFGMLLRRIDSSHAGKIFEIVA